MAERLAIAKENGENLSVEFVSCFAVPEIQKHFLITTSNEIDPNGLVVLNVSEIQNNKLAKVQSDDDWSKIKQVMRSIISSSLGEFKYLPIFADINAGIDYARNISVQGVAKDQLVKDYYEKKPSGGSSSPTPAPDEPVVDVPLNPALGNVPAPIGMSGSEVAPGIVEVNGNEQMVSDQVQSVEDFQKVQITESPTDLITNPNQATITEQPLVADQNVGNSVVPSVDNGVIPIGQPIVNQGVDVSSPVVQSASMASQQEIVPQLVNPAPVDGSMQPMTMPQMAVNQQNLASAPVMTNQTMSMGMQPVMNGNLSQQLVNPVGVPVQTSVASPMNAQTNLSLINNGVINFDQIVAEAKEVFLESSRNLAEVIIANAFESIRMKEEELQNREIIVAQREAAVNQQTMLSMNQMPYGQVPVNTYPNPNNQTQV